MEDAMDLLIDRLLCSDTDVIRQATDDLVQAYENPQTILGLCQIAVSTRPSPKRQFAVVLMNKRFGRLRFWQALPENHRELIKTTMLQALISEQDRFVKNAISQFIGSLVRHEADKRDNWHMELLNFIFGQCTSLDDNESELGSTTFSVLACSAPDQFANNMHSICQMYSAVLVNAEAKGNLASKTVRNVLQGMVYLMPFVICHTFAEQAIQKSMSLLISCAQQEAKKNNADEFALMFEIFESIVEYSPKVINNHVRLILDFCLETIRDKMIADQIRIQVITFICQLMPLKRKFILKQKLLEPMLHVFFETMCNSHDDDASLTDNVEENVLTSATTALDTIASSFPSEKVIPPLIQMLESGLQSPDPFRRRASYLSIALIVEGCADIIISKYLEIMINIIKTGINDSEPIVRLAAFFALGQFSEYLQPDISKFAADILPVLFEYLHQLVLDLKNQSEPKHMERMFYALQLYCENLEENIAPHLPRLMECLFETLDEKNSTNVRGLALTTIAATAPTAKENMVPYFPQIVTILQRYLVKDIDESLEELRIDSIDTLAALLRAIGKQNGAPLANDSMNYCLLMLESGPDDPTLRRSIYNLIGALSNVGEEHMGAVFPKIMNRLIESVLWSEMNEHTSYEDYKQSFKGIGEKETEVDLESTDDEEDVELDYVRNEFVNEKEEAILVLRECAANCGSSFNPYVQTVFENVYKCIDVPMDGVRRAAVDALCQCVISLNNVGDVAGVTRACEILLPKFAQILRNDDEPGVVIKLFDTLGEVFESVKKPSIPNAQMADLIFKCIHDTLLKRMACQFTDPCGDEDNDGDEDEDGQDMDSEEMILDGASNLLPQLGFALTPEIFATYFEKIFPIYESMMNKAKKNDMTDQRAFLYGVLAVCFEHLNSYIVNYFDTLFPLFMGGITDKNPMARQNVYFGLGEMVLKAGEKSYNYFPHILQGLSNAIAKEKEPAALDNICGAVGRLILTNHNIVPLEQVLPVLMANLPLREDKKENEIVVQVFGHLYIQARPVVENFIEQMLTVCLQILYEKELPEESNQNTLAFVKQIKEDYPVKFQSVMNSNPTLYNFVHTL